MDSPLAKFVNRLLDDGTSSLRRCPHCGYYNCLWATPYMDMLDESLAELAAHREFQSHIVLDVEIAEEHTPELILSLAGHH